MPKFTFLFPMTFLTAFILAFSLQAEAANTHSNTTPLGDSAIENANNPLIQIETSLGKIVVELFPTEAPITVANFLALADGSKVFIDPETGDSVKRPFYDGLIFHRVIDGFMIQGGSPTGLGDGGPGYSFDDEINAQSLGLDKMPVMDDNGYPHPLLGVSSQSDFQQKVLSPLYRMMDISTQQDLDENIDAIEQRLKALTVMQSFENLGYRYIDNVLSRSPKKGVIAMANSGANTNGSQFFITLADTDWLTGKHTVFGEVKSGIEVLDSIAKTKVDAQARPLTEIRIISIQRLN